MNPFTTFVGSSTLGVAVSSVGDVYIAVSSQSKIYVIKKGSPESSKTVFATLPGSIKGMTFNSHGDLYVAGTSTCTVYKVNNITGTYTTVVGTGGCSGNSVDGTFS